MPTKVMVQHRSHSLLEVLAGSVATEPGMRLVGVAHNGTEALRLCQREHPDVALIEADPSGWDAPALAAQAARRPAGAARPRAVRARLPVPRALGISSRTVENLQHRLFRKLGVRNRAEAVAAAHARRLLTPPE